VVQLNVFFFLISSSIFSIIEDLYMRILYQVACSMYK